MKISDKEYGKGTLNCDLLKMLFSYILEYT